MATEIILASPTIPKLLSYKKLKMPIFQRHYGWGEKDKEGVGVAYFQNFLTNKNGSTFFGQVNIFSDRRWDYVRDTSVEVGIADGQHRLVTLLLALLALRARLARTMAAAPPTDGDPDKIEQLAYDKEQSSEFLDAPEVKSLFDSSLEAVLDSSGRAEQVVPFIHTSLASINDLEARKLSVASNYDSARLAIKKLSDKSVRRFKKKALDDAEKRELSKLDESLKSLKQIGVLRTYLSFEESLKSKPHSAAANIANIFLSRVRALKASVVCLQPAQGEVVDISLIEEEAFAMFSQLNGQAIALTAGELLKSYLDSKTSPDSKLSKFFKEGTSEYQAGRFFGVDSSEKLCDFFTKVMTGDGNKKSYSWVKAALYGGQATHELLSELEGWVAVLEGVYQKLTALEEPWLTLFQMFMTDLGRVPYVVFLSRCARSQGLASCDDSFMKRLFRLLVLFELASHYRTPKDGRFNIPRDIPGLNLSTLNTGFDFVEKHFTVDTGENLLNSVSRFVRFSSLGEPKARGLAKILLILADVHGGVKDIRISKQISYEHVFPQKCSSLLDDDNIPDNISEGIEAMLTMSTLDRSKLINQIGNGMLLGQPVNSALSNSSPYVKYLDQLSNSELINAWWPSHLRDLQTTQGNFDKECIERRSERLAAGIAEFLCEI